MSTSVCEWRLAKSIEPRLHLPEGVRIAPAPTETSGFLLQSRDAFARRRVRREEGPHRAGIAALSRAQYLEELHHAARVIAGAFHVRQTLQVCFALGIAAELHHQRLR